MKPHVKQIADWILEHKGPCGCEPEVGHAPCMNCATEDLAKDYLDDQQKIGVLENIILKLSVGEKLEPLSVEYSVQFCICNGLPYRTKE